MVNEHLKRIARNKPEYDDRDAANDGIGNSANERPNFRAETTYKKRRRRRIPKHLRRIHARHAHDANILGKCRCRRRSEKPRHRCCKPIAKHRSP